ncbi:hypothetical protein KP509_01G044500 [Ceratopteris richardii]|uniref:Uncharacterized protein n=1 Tax=Ceratopteris richardii TaxID=49495 RepID=A0A8T2VP18_CERRI|nr:hypothetical protein KP509_01G044500 [Ceratopteris richardii]
MTTKRTVQVMVLSGENDHRQIRGHVLALCKSSDHSRLRAFHQSEVGFSLHMCALNVAAYHYRPLLILHFVSLWSIGTPKVRVFVEIIDSLTHNCYFVIDEDMVWQALMEAHCSQRPCHLCCVCKLDFPEWRCLGKL